MKASSYLPGPSCSIASQVIIYRMTFYPHLFSLAKCSLASSCVNGRPSKDTLSPSKKPAGSWEGTSGFLGSLESPEIFIPLNVISRPSLSRNLVPSIRKRWEPIASDRPSGRTHQVNADDTEIDAHLTRYMQCTGSRRLQMDVMRFIPNTRVLQPEAKPAQPKSQRESS